MTKSQLLTLRRVLQSSRFTADQKRTARKILTDSLSSVPDSLTRHALTLYLLHGYTWQRVAMEMGWADESTPRQLCREFLNQK